MKHTLLITTALMLVVGFSNADAQTYQYIKEVWNNGLPKVINTFKESKGKLELVKTIEWMDDGYKWSEGTYKGVDKYGNPQENGKWTRWHENRQKWYERTFKDGVLISVKCWDEDGNEVDCPEWMLN